jgi:sec-independent protein translocase protein TatC
MAEEKEMAFLDHLEELRWHVVRASASIVIGMIASFIYIKEIFEYVIFAPGRITFPTFSYMCKIGQTLNLQELCLPICLSRFRVAI